jgi:holo-[acyl-carrier protein] synthase
VILAIVGLGVGIVETERFRRAERRFGGRLAERVFTPGERAYAARRRRGFESLAVRFAAKLAARRALGLAHARFRDLEVVRLRGAAPTLVFHAAAAAAARERGVARAALSVTHDADLCIAHVVLEGAT